MHSFKFDQEPLETYNKPDCEEQQRFVATVGQPVALDGGRACTMVEMSEAIASLGWKSVPREFVLEAWQKFQEKSPDSELKSV